MTTPTDSGDGAFHLAIDGQEVMARPGETILDAALASGIHIPNLCVNSKVSHVAVCRLCVVKVEGQRGTIPSCTTPAAPGMVVTAFDEELEEIRRMLLELQLSAHNDDCISCPQSGNCTLEDLAFRYNLGKEDRILEPLWKDLGRDSDRSSPVLDYDATKCIQCGRCVRACKEIQGKNVLTFVNRGLRNTVATGHKQWSDSACDGCGECVQICPVGAITSKTVYGSIKRIREKDVETRTITTCPYCGVGCQLEIGTRQVHNKFGEPLRDEIIQVKGAECLPNYGSTCVKGRFGLDFVESADRLKTPLVRRGGTLQAVSWSEAITYSAKRLLEIREAHGPDALAGLASARCTNEENYLFQKLMRSVIGTNNVDHCARLCHASTVAGLATVLGSGAMTNSIAELEQAEVILVTGSNTTEAHPVIANRIKRAVQENKARLIVVDPRRIDLVKHARLWLRQNLGTDVAWLNGMVHVILEEGLHDAVFLAERTEGFDALQAAVAEYTPAYVESITGIPAGDLREAARLYAGAERASICYAMGITQHSHGTDNVKGVANLALVTGNLGKAGAGVNPLRGQNNVQGACDMGALPNVYPGYQKVADPAARARFEAAWGQPLPPGAGKSVVEIVQAAGTGDVQGLYIMGENPVVSDPNTNHVEASLQQLEFLLVQDIFLSETAQLADVVLPAVSFAEKSGTFTNTERRVLPVQPVMAPIGQAKPDWLILQHLAQCMGHFWEYAAPADILAEINALTPSYHGITPERIAAGERLQWPCPARDHPGTPFLHKGSFARGKALLSALAYKPPAELPDAAYPLQLTTGRIINQYHTGTMSRRSKPLTGYTNHPFVEISAADLARYGLMDGQTIEVCSRRGKIRVAAKASRRVKEGVLFIPFHFAEGAANRLTNDVLDPDAKIPELKVCAVAVQKVG